MSLIPQTPKPSAKELEQGKKPRAETRAAMLVLKEKWDKQYKPLNEKLALASKEVYPLTSLFDTQESWYQKNIEVTKQQVETQSTKFKESYDSYLPKYIDAVRAKLQEIEVAKAQEVVNQWPNENEKNQFQLLLSQRQRDQEALAKEAKKKEQKKSVMDIVWEVWNAMKLYIFLLAYILIALRFASFSANKSFHKPLLYRILDFIYTFIFAPFYLLLNLKEQIGPFLSDKFKYPTFYSFFPLEPYEEKPDTEPSIRERFFGYPNASDVKKEVLAKRKEEEDRAIAFSANTSQFLKELLEAKEEERKTT